MTPDDWRKRIVCDPGLHHGEPCIRGTRIAVSAIVASITDLGIDGVMEQYPQLIREDVRAAQLYSANVATSS